MHNDAGTRSGPSDTQLDLMLQRMETGMLVVDNDGHVFFVNRAAASLLGAVEGKVDGKLNSLLPHAAFLFEGKETRLRSSETVTLPDGTRRVIGFLTEAVGDRRLALIWDASQDTQAEDRRNRAEQLAAMAKLASRLGHEIRNPLAGVLAGLQTLETGSTLGSEDLFVLRLVLEEVRSVIRIVKKLADSVRTDVSSPSPVHVGPFLQNVVDSCIRDSGKNKVKVEMIPGEKAARVVIDTQSMERAIEHLLRLLLEAASGGGQVAVGWRELGEGETRTIFPGFVGTVVGIYGEGSCAGLPKSSSTSVAVTPRIGTKRGDLGLGPAAAQEIVELHGGVLLLGKSPRGATTFEVLIPALDGRSRPESPVLDECGVSSGEAERCPHQVKSAEVPTLCWVEHGCGLRRQTGEWPESCVRCPVFKSGNLRFHFDRGGFAGKGW
jgi:two-component system, NtrC family, sensor histidine kinase PilS